MAKKETDVSKLAIDAIHRLPVRLIRPNPDQPRKHFDQDAIKVLADSFERKGDVDYPLMVTVVSENGSKQKSVMLIDGERRWRAAQLAGLKRVSCHVKGFMSADEIYLTSARMNLCREDMSPIEEACVIQRVMKSHGWNQVEAGKQLGKSPAQVSNALKYLRLHKEIQILIIHRKLDKGIGLQLSVYEERDQPKLLKKITEALAANDGKPIHPNDVARILRLESEKRGMVPVKPTRGRTHISHADLVVGNITAKLQNLSRALEELHGIEKEALENLREYSLYDLMVAVEAHGREVSKTIERLRDFA